MHHCFVKWCIFILTLPSYLKTAISILFLVVFLPGLFNQGIIILNYELNKEVITELFCINKDKPMLSCAGQCHLKKQLEKEQEKEEEKENTQQESVQFISISIVAAFQKLKAFSSTEQNHNCLYLFTPSTTYFTDIFHPPRHC